MNYDIGLKCLQKMLTNCHVRNLVINPNEPIHSYMDTALTGVAGYRHTFYEFVSEVKPATVYRLLDVFLCRYIFLELPDTDRPSVLLVGPYLVNSLSHQQILEQAERMGQQPTVARELELYYSTIPVVREEHHLFAMVNAFSEYVFGGENQFDSVDLYFNQGAVSLPEFHQENPVLNKDALNVEVMENRYRFENELIEAVAQGNSHRAEMLLANLSMQSSDVRTSDQLRNAKNHCIIINTLLRKAAEHGRVHPVHLERVSSDFSRRIEALRSIAGINTFVQEIVRGYCRLVKRHSMKSYSPLVQKAMIVIEGDLTGDLSLSAVAEKNNVSPGYLSGLFKKETGQTFTAYVNGRRVAMAKRLLKTTHLQIQTIAQHCGVLDFHYFCRLFKNVTGKTPTEYRSGHTAASEG